MRMRQDERAGSRRRRLTGFALVMAFAAAIDGAVIAPPDAFQGQAQRLMYVHVPSAWTAYLCFGVAVVTAILQLVHRDRRWDRWRHAAVEVGVVATASTLLTGSVWGRLVWGVWWTWDARLTATALLFLAFCFTLAIYDTGRHARRAAVATVVASALIPVVHFSVLWWRTLHQPPTVLTLGSHPIAGSMALALGLSVVAATAIAVRAVLWRHDVAVRREVSGEAPGRLARSIGAPASASAPAPAPAPERELAGVP